MKSAVAILTYNRSRCLRTTLTGLTEHCLRHPIAIFEDAGHRDPTRHLLIRGRTDSELVPEIEAVKWVSSGNPMIVFLGERNLGVAGNSNRALWWFLNQTDADHLVLCNDDILVSGDFVSKYAEAHQNLGVDLWCKCDFVSESHRPITVPYRGYNVKILPRMTGIIMSMTKRLVQTIGFFDTRFGKFGEEHCDFTIRARFHGFMALDGQPQPCLDVENPFATHQEDVESSMQGKERELADRVASQAMQEAAMRYRQQSFYVPYMLSRPAVVGGMQGGGIPFDYVERYPRIVDRVPAIW